MSSCVLLILSKLILANRALIINSRISYYKQLNLNKNNIHIFPSWHFYENHSILEESEFVFTNEVPGLSLSSVAPYVKPSRFRNDSIWMHTLWQGIHTLCHAFLQEMLCCYGSKTWIDLLWQQLHFGTFDVFMLILLRVWNIR